MSLAPRAVVVHRRTELEDMLARHGSHGAAAFFLRSRGQDLALLEARHKATEAALRRVAADIPLDWRRGTVERGDLDRFLFAPDDIVIVVGQDGLVANVAKYLTGQPVLGVNPDPAVNPGVLVPLAPTVVGDRLTQLTKGAATVEHRTMVQGRVDDTQTLFALNEIFLGHPSHQSARYTLMTPGGERERQSSSGLIVGTGTGATGWCRSIALERGSAVRAPSPTDRTLTWFVREAWPSPATGTSHTEGVLAGDAHLTITGETDGLVLFGDGIETDHITLAWGQQVTLSVAAQSLSLVR
jgi:hypothetical protein